MKKSTQIILIIMLYIASTSFILNAAESDDLNPDDIFRMSLHEMMSVKVVTSGKKETPVSKIPASVVIITREDIERYGYQSLEAILENVPGLYAIDDISGYRTTFGVRGFWTGYPRNIIFLVNGVNQTDGLFNYHLLSTFNIPVEAIDRIEVIRGPMSVMYGTDAFFGAINIITNDPKNDNNILSVSMGSQHTIRFATCVSGKEGDIHFAMNAGYYNCEGPNEPLSRMVSNPKSLGAYGITSHNSSTQKRLENNAKYASCAIDYNNFYTHLSYNQSINEIYLLVPSFSKGSSYLRRMTKGVIGYKNQITDFLTIDAHIGYHSFSMQMDLDHFSNSVSGYSMGQAEIYETEFVSYFKPGNTFEINTGCHFQQNVNTVFSGELYDFGKYSKDYPIDNIKTGAFYTQAYFRPFNNLLLVSGLRLEKMKQYTLQHIANPGRKDYRVITGDNDPDNIEIIPRFAAIYQLTDNHIFKLLYGKAIARPSFFQNQDQVQQQHPPLKSETIQTFELNYISMFEPYCTINTSYFYNILNNLITRKVSPEPGDFAAFYTNGGKITTHGIEMTVQMYPTRQFQSEMSLVWQKSKDHRNGFENIDIAYSPHLLAYLKASYLYNRDISFSLTGKYVDDMKPHWDIIRQNPDGSIGGRIGHKVDAYYTIDLNCRISNILNKGYYINLNATNLFDEDYLYPTYVNNSNWEDKGTIGHERLIMLTVGRQF